MEVVADENCLERAVRATDGPWTNHRHIVSVETIDLPNCCDNPGECNEIATLNYSGKCRCSLMEEINAEFIAHAREDVPTLANMVIKLERDNEELARRLKKACEALRRGSDEHWDTDLNNIADELEAVPEGK